MQHKKRCRSCLGTDTNKWWD